MHAHEAGNFIELLKHAIMITGFVFTMMVLIEYINVQTAGAWQRVLTKRRWMQYLLATLLGLLPGCLGSFAVVSLYAHGLVSFGALVAVMIATSGDESFVMFAMIPQAALVLNALLFVVAMITGPLVDLVLKGRRFSAPGTHMRLHEMDHCVCYPRGQIYTQLRNMKFDRFILMTALGLMLLFIGVGEIGPEHWDWVRITLLVVTALGMFIVSTVPEHFIEHHLWEHVVKRHLPGLFGWVLGALIVVHLLTEVLDLQAIIRDSPWTMMGLAALVGIIPASGPHLLFVTLFSQGSVPFSVLTTSSIAQDGHGMLPLLAHSRKDFIVVKAINVAVALLVGGIILLLHH